MTIDPQTFGIIFALLIVLAMLLIWKSLRKLTASNDHAYDWQDLLMENGRASKAAHVMMGAFCVTTWHFVYYSLTNRMSEGYYGLYSAAWIAPVVMRMFAGNGQQSQSGAQTTTTTTTETK